MSHTYSAIVDQPRIKLKAIRRQGARLDRSNVCLQPSVTLSKSCGRLRSSKMHIHELVGEAYTVLSLAAIVGVLIYHIAG